MRTITLKFQERIKRVKLSNLVLGNNKHIKMITGKVQNRRMVLDGFYWFQSIFFFVEGWHSGKV
jgi:hypothetical protein